MKPNCNTYRPHHIMSLCYRYFVMVCLSVRYLLIVQSEKMQLTTTVNAYIVYQTNSSL